MKVIVAGGTGLIGGALVNSLVQDGHEVIVLSRRPGRPMDASDAVQMVYWDAKTAEGWGHHADGADAIVNLTGENLAGKGIIPIMPQRWTPKRRQRILESRVNAGHAIVEAVRAAKVKPGVVVQASAIGYYGPQEGDQALTEAAPPASDFLSRVCQDWEASTEAVERLGVRRVVLRSGAVLSTEDGALPRQLLPFQLFAGGPMGSGKQWYSWIHLDDEVRAIRFLLANSNAKGVYNLVAPNPVTNADFSKTLGKVTHRPSWLPIPAFVFQLAFGEVATVVVDGQRVAPAKLLDQGFTFRFSEVEPALRDLLAD